MVTRSEGASAKRAARTSTVLTEELGAGLSRAHSGVDPRQLARIGLRQTEQLLLVGRRRLRRPDPAGEEVGPSTGGRPQIRQSRGRRVIAAQPRLQEQPDRPRRRGVDCGASTLDIERGGVSRTVVVARLADSDRSRILQDRPGETFQLLSPRVAYLKLSSVRARDIDRYIERASGTRGLVIDIRNYPSEFVVFGLGSRLVQEPTPFARFTVGDLDNPGAFTWTPPLTLEPATPGFEGKVAILVDETSISQAEYTAMALRAGPRAVVVGSTTAGADGNVSAIRLPGNVSTMISGIGVFYPDKTPTQRVGIVPDIVVTPTIEGIRAGRDEVLEEALRYILGPDADDEVIREMARHP